jgi:rhomboid protease GluP
MNMMGLLILGPFIERVLGWFKFFVIYSISGLGAAIGIAYAPLWFGTQPEFTVGASGAIMGLVGAIAAVTLWGWLVERVSIAAKRFKTVMFMIGIQIAFDFSTPQISTTGHLSGLVVGFVVTLLVIGLFGFKEPSNRSLA